MSLPALVSLGEGTFRAHVIDHRSTAQPLQTPQRDDGHEPMPSPRSARARDAARTAQQTPLRGSYAPPARGTRAMYIPTPRKVPQTLAPAPKPPVLPAQRQPSATTFPRRPEAKPVGAADASSPGSSLPPPWWWPQNLDASSEKLPQSLASMLASQMVKVEAGSSELPEGPTPALPPAVRKRALNVAETPLKLVNAAVRTRAPPGQPLPSWAEFDIPLTGGQWRGDPLVASMVRSQELSRTGNEKLFESADSLVLDADAHDGPMVQLSPHGCTFAGEPVRMTFAIDRLVEGHLGDAFIVVLRKRSGGPWVPLEEDERLTISPTGAAVVELREFSWVKAWGFSTSNQDNEVADLFRTVLGAGMGDNQDNALSESRKQATLASRPKKDGGTANRLGYVGIAPESSGYLIPGVAAIAVTAADGALKVLNNPQLAQRTAKEFSADSPLKLLSASFGGYCYPVPPSDGEAEEKMQIAFLSHAVPEGEVFGLRTADEDLETVAEHEKDPEQDHTAGQVDDEVEEVDQTSEKAEVDADLSPDQPDDATLVALLLSAARRGDTAEVERLLSLGVGVHSVDDEGCSALMAAAGGDQAVAVNQLLDAGATDAVDLVNMHGETALLMAAESGSHAAAELLLNAGAKVDMIDHDGQSAVLHAARMGHSAVVNMLIDRGAGLNPDVGEMPLHAAAENNHVDVVQLLLKGGADVDKTDSYGNTALMNAAVAGYTEVVTQLLQDGATADLEGSGGQTALMKAAKANTADCVAALVKGNASLNSGDDNGDTALMLAASKGHAQLVQQLLDSGASTVRRNDAGQSALDVAKEFAEEKQWRGDGSDESDASEVVAVLERWASMNEPEAGPEMETKPSQLPAEEEVDTHEERGDTALAPTNS